MQQNLESIGRAISDETDDVQAAMIEKELVIRLQSSGRKFRTSDAETAMFLYDLFASGKRVGVKDVTQKLKNQ